MKVLALHGKQQNAEVFRGRCGKLTARAVREKVVTQFYFYDAPHTLPLKDGDQVPMRTWYLRQKDGRVDENSLEQTLSELEEVWRTHGPFDGILGFSMGGAMASIVATLPSRFPNLFFVLSAGAPDIETKHAIDQRVQSLHLIGLDDRTVLPKSSHALANKYRDARVAEHELGHCLPMKANHMQLYLQFLQDMQHILAAQPQYAARLILEIDAHSLLAYGAEVQAFCEQLHALDVRVGLRRLAQQPGALMYLHRAPLNYVKLGGDFVTDLLASPGSQQLLIAITQTAKELNIAVYVDDVPDDETVGLLDHFGAYSLQMSEPHELPSITSQSSRAAP